MSHSSDIESIDTVAVKRLSNSGETAVDNIHSQWVVFRTVLGEAIDVNDTHGKADSARGLANSVDIAIEEMRELNGHILFVLDRIMDPPAFDYPWNLWISGADTYVPLDRTQGLKTDWTKLREKDQLVLKQWAPDVVLMMSNVPKEIRRAAEQAWFDAVDSDVEVYGREQSLHIHVRVFWFDADLGLTREMTVYADGSVRVEYLATGELGAVVGAGVASAEAGVEASVLVAHRFDSVDELDRFEAQLEQEVFSADLDTVAAMLLGNSCTNAVMKVGGYAGVQAGVGSGQLMEARLGVGVGRDWKTEESIFYISGRVALHESGGRIGTSGSSLGALATGQVDVIGERRQGVETDRVVLDVSFETKLSVLGSLLGEPSSLVNNVRGSLSADVEVTATLELDLEDLDTREAWDNFMNGQLGIGDLFQYASLDGNISTSATAKTGGGGTLGAVAIQVTASTTERVTLGTFHKESGMGRATRWLSKGEIERLSR